MTVPIPSPSDDPASVTPVPSIHNIPPDDSGAYTPPDAAQFQAWGDTLLNEAASAILMALTNVTVLGVQPFAGLSTFGTEILDATTDIEDLISGVTGSGGTGSGLATLLNDLSTGNVQGVIDILVDAFTGGSTTGNAPSALTTAILGFVQGLFGSATSPGILGSIPSTAVSNFTQNLQPVSSFPNAASVQAGGQWSWDGTIDHTGTAGSGSAKVVANGQLNQLLGVPGAVQPGQVVTPAGFVTWSGLSAAGGSTPIELQLIPWSGTSTPGTPGTPVVPSGCSITSPGASSSTFTGELAGWVPLTGSYTVPSSGVGFVQLALTVTAAATAGDVNFDDCADNVTGGFLADLEADITDIIGSFAPGGTAAEFQTGVSDLLSLFGLSSSTVASINVTSVWTTIVNDVINPLNAIETQANNVIVGVGTDLTNLFDSLFGTTTPTTSSQVSQTSVSSSTGLASLEADIENTVSSASTEWTNLVTSAENTWNSLFGSAPTSGTQTIEQDVVSGLTGLADDAENAWNSLFGGAPTSGTQSISQTGAVQAAALPTITIGGVVDSIEGHIQNAVDTLNNAQSGTAATGTAIASLATSYTNIPATNVVGGEGAAVTFGAVGTGNIVTGVASSQTVTETHDPVTGDLGVLAVVSYIADVASVWNSTVTYGGTPMTKLGEISSTSNIGGAGAVFLEVWWLKSPAVGTSASVVSTVTRTSGAGNIQFLSVDTASYSGSKVGTVNTFSGGGGTSLSMTASSVANDLIFGAFSEFDASFSPNTLSGFTPTQRGNQASICGVAFGDGTGTSSVVFGATSNHTATSWMGITVQLSN